MSMLSTPLITAVTVRANLHLYPGRFRLPRMLPVHPSLLRIPVRGQLRSPRKALFIILSTSSCGIFSCSSIHGPALTATSASISAEVR